MMDFFWIYNTCSLPNYIILIMNRFCFRWSRLLRLARARWNLLSGYRTRKSVNLAIYDKYCMSQLCIKQYKDGGRGTVKVMFSRNELLKTKWITLFHQSLVPLSLSRARVLARFCMVDQCRRDLRMPRPMPRSKKCWQSSSHKHELELSRWAKKD